MERWKLFGLGAGVLVVLLIGMLTSVLVGFAGPTSRHRPPAPSTDAPSSTGMPSTAAPVAPDGPVASAPDAPEPRQSAAADGVRRYPGVTRTAAQLRSGAADLYLPLAASAGAPARRFPVAVLVADSRTDPGQYEQLAHDLGTYGIAVVVSDRGTGPAVREVAAWAAAVRADPSDYLNDKLARSVAFVVLTGDARPLSNTPASVRAQVRVAPTNAERSPSRAPTLLVCADRAAARAACAASSPALARVVVPRSGALTITDEGARGPRTSTLVDGARLRTIAAFARPAALWLLAHQGDARARAVVDAQLVRP